MKKKTAEEKDVSKEVVESRISAKEAAQFIRDHAIKDDIIHLRVAKKRKEEIKNRAKEAGVTLSAYLLMAEEFFFKSMGSSNLEELETFIDKEAQKRAKGYIQGLVDSLLEKKKTKKIAG